MNRPQYPVLGHCRIAITSPVAALLAKGAGVEFFLDELLQGHLDTGGRTHKFNIDPNDWRHRQPGKRAIPSGFPSMKGDVTWRKKDQRWQLDVSELHVVEGITWQEQVAGSVCDGCLVMPGILPEAVKNAHAHGPVHHLVDSALFGNDCIVHTIIDWPGSPPGAFGKGRPDMTKVYIHCDRNEYNA